MSYSLRPSERYTPSEGSNTESDSADQLPIPSLSLGSHSQDALPPLSSEPDLIRSSPVKGTANEKAEIRRRKAQRKRSETVARQRAEKEANEKAKHITRLENAFNAISQCGVTFGELSDYIFNPENKQNSRRYDQFFRVSGRAMQTINWWLSSANSPEARSEVHEAVITYTCQQVHREARNITRKRLLQRITINSEAVAQFDLDDITTQLSTASAIAMRLFMAFSSSSKHYGGQISEARKAKKLTIVVASMLQCLGEHSHANSDYKRMLGLYFYAVGTGRQPFTILNHLGITESYSNLTAKGVPSAQPTSESTLPALVGVGTLHKLSATARDEAQRVAHTGLYVTVYDNINFMTRTPEQIIGRSDTQQNGTCATIWPLHDANIEDMDLSEFHRSFLTARSLNIFDILHTNDEATRFREFLIYDIIRIIVRFGGNGFRRFEKDLKKNQPKSASKIDVHQTKVYPLPSFNINESTINGNAKVNTAIIQELKLEESPHWRKTVRIIAGKEGGAASLNDVVFIPGLFHVKIADMHGMFTVHWGKANTGTRNPGCLAFHNTVLYRQPITPTSLPPFRTCRDLIFVSLYSRVLHCLLLVSGKASLEDYTTSIDSWDSLYMHAASIYDQFVNTTTVHELRWKRQQHQAMSTIVSNSSLADEPQCTEGDMVYENGILLLRDALLSREFTDAIKAGDMDRVILVLKVWALSFRGNGRTKYAYEMLHLIHNLTVVWPKGLRDLVLKNCLVNTTGKDDGFSEADLLQEHGIGWIKGAYQARGSNGSWPWLEMISPCIQTLRQLVNVMKGALGTDNGSKHAPPDLTKDIKALMNSLDEHSVYRLQKGRTLGDDGGPVPDAVTYGLQQLTDTNRNPLDDYNQAFKQLQARHTMVPVVGQEEGQREDAPNVEDEGGGCEVQTASETSTAAVLGSFDGEEQDPEDEGRNELVDVLVEDGEETLKLLTMEDVALDMDVVEVIGDDFDDVDSDDDEDESEVV
ncbi:hypothetical protein EYR40_006087 [Pleurotus pulmonarius]|nr:hypothetical protein EYR40_006087 [Pleurotus pulmonarius]